MTSKKILDALEAWVAEQAKKQHDRFVTADWPESVRSDGQATAYENTLEKIAEFKGQPWL